MRRRALSSSIKTGPKIELQNYLTFEALADNFAVSLSANNIEYCIDGDGNWKALAKATKTPYVGKGHLISIRAALRNENIGTNTGCGTFSATSDFALSGDPLSLFFRDTTFSEKTFPLRGMYKLFENATSLIEAHGLIMPQSISGNGCANMFNGCSNLKSAPALPALELSSSAYLNMFKGCTALDEAPVLPATTVFDQCYSGMFYGCTSLKTAPELPATAVKNGSYKEMFKNCTALINAPELPATTLDNHCYNGMFYGCTNLQTAPELLATVVYVYGYYNMFYGCKNIKYIKAMLIDNSPTNCLTDWVKGVSSSGTFVKNAAATWDVTGTSGVPSGWTVETATE